MTFEPKSVEDFLRAERYRRWAETERKMRVIGALAFWVGFAAITLVVVDAIQKWH